MNPPAARTIAVRRRAARSQRLGAQVVVLDVETQCAHSLDGVVAAVWEAAEAPATTSKLLEVVREASSDAVTAAHIDDAIDVLCEAGLLEIVGERAIDRRRLLTLGAGAAFAGAAIVTIGLPTPAAALSTGGPAPEFLNTTGYSLSSDDVPGDGTESPTIQSLRLSFTGTGTPPDYGVITINPNPDSIPPLTWSLDSPNPNGSMIALFDYVDLLDEPDRSSWFTATSLRVWFYDSSADPDLFLGQAYFTSSP